MSGTGPASPWFKTAADRCPLRFGGWCPEPRGRHNFAAKFMHRSDVCSAALKGSDGGGCFWPLNGGSTMNRRLHVFPVAVLAAVLLSSAPVPAQDNSVAANQEVRIQQLEGQIRSLNGQLEQMNFRLQQMTDRLDKLVADVDFRLRQVEGGGAPATPGEQGAADTRNQTAAAPPEQPPPAESNSGAMNQNQAAAGAMSGGTGQPRTLGTMSQGQYDAQKQQLKQNADAGAAASAAGRAGNAGAATAGNEQSAATSQPYALPGANADEQYQYAFDLMRQTKYADAEKALGTFVDEYPDHPLAGNASYWLGETYYVRKDYNNAALTFAQTFQKYPQSAKAPDSLLKLGMSLAALGETADACKALHELSVRYPKAADATKQRAAKEQAKNGCK
jgi:tol-pal system protein YbgF